MLIRDMLRLSLLVLSLFSVGAYAERINDPMHVLEHGNGECSGAGFFLWDSSRCLFKDDSIFLDGGWIRLERKQNAVIRQKKQNAQSIGDKYRTVYQGESVTVKLELTLLPAKCSYADDQCSYRNYFAHVVVIRPNKPTLEFDGVGYSGS